MGGKNRIDGNKRCPLYVRFFLCLHKKMRWTLSDSSDGSMGDGPRTMGEDSRERE